MKKSEVEVGKCYQATVSGKLTTVRVDSIEHLDARPPYRKKSLTRYVCTNLTTKREVLVKSATKFRKEVTS